MVYFFNSRVLEEKCCWTREGRLAECEFDEFTSAVQLKLYILSSHTILSAQREDGTAGTCHLSKVTKYADCIHISTLD